MKSIAVVIAASGNSQRFLQEETGTSKIFTNIAGTALIARTITAFAGLAKSDTWEITSIMLVMRQQDMTQFKQLDLQDDRICSPVIGGDTRQKSIYCGLQALEKNHSTYDYVLVHDGARGCIAPEKIAELCDTIVAQECAAALSLPVQDTLISAGEASFLTPIARDQLYAMQTPQAFPFVSFLEAHRQNITGNYSDDVSL
ncbi:MAG: 2-C-methyl-D-erythritol 4-phosphate cytidylyltransferase, partial [Pseudomonadota bacterium]